MNPSTPLLRIDNLEKHFPVQKNFFEQLQLPEGPHSPHSPDWCTPSTASA
jgi:hypothetical protein